MLFGGALLAMNTGEREEDRVERVVADAALERHAGYAEQFVWAAGATFALAALVLVFRRPPAALLLVTATAGASLVVAGLALRVGKAGGELVYVHNAASAYTSAAFGGTVETQSATVTAGEQSPTAPAPHREEDERRGERRRRR
jgi:pimeloyl-ACP methyl ester carboxylesterase